MKLSLCLAVQSGANHLARCLESVVKAVDEIIVIDLNHDDNTYQFVKNFGAPVVHFSGSNMEEIDTCIEEASSDWILLLNTSEMITPQGLLKIRQIIEVSDVCGYFLRIDNDLANSTVESNCPDMVLRLFKKTVWFQYDDILACSASSFRMAEGIVIVNHHTEDKKGQADWSLHFIEQQLVKRQLNKLAQYHHSILLYKEGKYNEAALELIKAAENLDDQTIYLPKLVEYLLFCLLYDKQYDNALRIIEQGLELYPKQADLYYYQGILYSHQAEYGLAYHAFKAAIVLPKQPEYYVCVHGTQGFRAYYYLGQIAEAFCSEEDALQNYILSLQDNSWFTPALEGILRILKPYKYPEYAKESLEKIFDFSNFKASLCLADLLFQQAAYDLAYEYFTKEETHETPELLLKKAICLAQQQNFPEAHTIFKGITSIHSVCERAKLNELFCWWLQGCQRQVGRIYEEIKMLDLSSDMFSIASLLNSNLGKRKAGKAIIGAEGISILLDFLQRAFAVGEWERGLTLLEGLDVKILYQINLDIAELCLMYGNMNLCEEYLNAHISKNGKCAAAYYYLAQIKEEQGLYFDAQCCCRQACTLDSKNPKYYIYLVNLYGILQQQTMAEVIQKYPDVTFIKFNNEIT